MKKTALLAVTLCFLGLTASAQESNNGKQLWAKSVLNEDAPELVVSEWISDQPDMEGKFVLVDFWATWCAPCKRVIPKLNEWQEKYADRLVIVGLSDESADKVKSMTEPEIRYASAVDPEARLKNELEVRGIPHVILISPQGKVVWEGFPTLSDHQLTEEVLENLMAKY